MSEWREIHEHRCTNRIEYRISVEWLNRIPILYFLPAVSRIEFVFCPIYISHIYNSSITCLENKLDFRANLQWRFVASTTTNSRTNHPITLARTPLHHCHKFPGLYYHQRAIKCIQFLSKEFKLIQ